MSEHPNDKRSPAKSYSNSYWGNIDPEDHPYPPPSKLEFNSLPATFFAQADEQGKACFARVRDPEDKQYFIISWTEAAAHIATIAKLLRDTCGVKKGYRVGLISNTRYEWMIADLAALSLGAVTVSILPAASPEQIAEIFSQTAPKVIFVENKEQFEKLPSNSAASESTASKARHIISFEKFSLENSAPPLLFPSYSEANVKNWKEIIERDVSRNDIATTIFPLSAGSSTAGIELSHGNFIAAMDMLTLTTLLDTAHDVFQYLPLSHPFVRLVAYTTIALGGNLTFPTVFDQKSSVLNERQLLKDIHQTHPRVISATPAFLKSIADRKRSSFEKFSLSFAKLFGFDQKHVLFGKKFKHALVIGASIPEEIANHFKSINAPLYLCFGIPEACGVLAANTPRYNKANTAGRIYEGIKVELGPNGRLRCRGDNVSAANLSDGWLQTNIAAVFDDEGYLSPAD